MPDNTEAQLAKQLVYFVTKEDAEATDTGTANWPWKQLKELDTVGSTGLMASPKDKTSISDDVMRYGSAMPDTPEKTIKGKTIQGDTDQRAFEAAADARKTAYLKVIWPNLNRGAIIEMALLGYEDDDQPSSEWATWTVKAKQSGAPEKGDATIKHSLDTFAG